MPTTENNNVIRYGSRTFGEIKTDLISMIREYYPEVLSDFTDSSVGSLLIDVNAGVTNNLAINTDRVFQETQLEQAQIRSSLINHAKTLGFNIPARRPSVTVVDFTVTVPVSGDRPNSSYYPTLLPGAQVMGGGKIFETQEVIDWNSPVSNLGDPNRAIIPNLDANGVVQSYSVTKREVVINGSTNIYKRVVNQNDVVPFFSLTLPDQDIIGIESVILVEGTNHSTNPDYSEFYSHDRRYYEVDYLAQQRVFVEDTNNGLNNNNDLKRGRWIDVTKKFLKEYTNNGFCKLTFGSGSPEKDAFKEGFIKEGVTNRQFLDNFLENTALGEKLKSGYTLFVRYRTGGGSNSNVGTDVLTRLGNFTLRVAGSRQDLNREVQRSLAVNNPIPAIGGNDGLNIEQIRNLIKYNFSSQFRDVSLVDYLLQVYKMPGRFGSPYRANVFREHNKVVITMLGLDNQGKLSNTSNTLLKENITEYLSEYRMINDYVEVRDGKIFNLAFDIDVYVQNISNNEIANNIISVVRDYLNIRNHEMNEDIYMGKLEREILNAHGVINIVDLKVYNKVGGQYSNNVVSQEISDMNTGEIKLVNNTLYSTRDSMFEIKYPSKDIRVILRKSGS